MIKHRSFKPSDFSLRDIPGFIMAYIVVSVLSIGLGLALEALPKFWAGFLCGAGFGLLCALVLLSRGKKEIDIAVLPEPSAHVRAKCDDPNCSRAEAVKAYCDEAELSLTEATAVLKAYAANRH